MPSWASVASSAVRTPVRGTAVGRRIELASGTIWIGTGWAMSVTVVPPAPSVGSPTLSVMTWFERIEP